MELNIDLAISIWRTDEGYRIINSFLTKSSSREDYIYHRKNNEIIKYEDPSNTITTYKTIDVINVIKQHMKKSDVSEPEIYYRGGSERSRHSFIKASFISVSSDEEQANQFVDGCCLYKVIVDPSVKRYKTGVEYETLLENDLYWEYKGKQGKYHVVNIKNPQENNLNIDATTENNKNELIEEKKDKLTEDELQSWLDVYKDEYLFFDDEATPEGFINYIKTENKQIYENNSILIQKLAYKMISKIGGKKRNKMMLKKSKNQKNKKNQKNQKN